MTEIDSTITFENGQITKCVLQIGGKTFTVTLVKGGYEVKEGGTAPCSTPGPAPGSNSSTTPAATAASTSTSTASTSTSTASTPLEEVEYNSQEKLIEKLLQHGYTAP